MSSASKVINEFVLTVCVVLSLLLFAFFMLQPEDVIFSPLIATETNVRSSGEEQIAQSKTPGLSIPVNEVSSKSNPTKPSERSIKVPAKTERQVAEVQPEPVDLSIEENVEEKISEAINLVDSQNWLAAEKILHDVLKASPDNEAALVELAMLHILDKNDPDGALPFIKRALSVNSENEAMIGELLGVLAEKGRSEEAGQFLISLSEETESNANLDYGIAQALIKTGSKEKALEYMERAVSDKDGFQRDDIEEQLGDLYYETGRVDLAIDSWKKTLERQAEYLNSHPEDRGVVEEHNLAVRLKYLTAQIDVGDQTSLEAAEEELQAIEKLAPTNPMVNAIREALRQRISTL